MLFGMRNTEIFSKKLLFMQMISILIAKVYELEREGTY